MLAKASREADRAEVMNYKQVHRLERLEASSRKIAEREQVQRHSAE
jgi:hypothetical protein